MKRLVLAIATIGFTLAASAGLADAAGTWTTSTPVPNFTSLAPGGGQIRSISCGGTGVCIGGGGFATAGGDEHSFLTEDTGTGWGDAFELPGVTAVPGLGSALVKQISCSADGGCSLVGQYTNGGVTLVFVATRGGGGAIDVPGLSALATGNQTQAVGISCASAGNCSIIGTYVDAQNVGHVFVSDQVDGTWTNVQTLTGFLADAFPESISCGAPDDCIAAGTTYGSSLDGFIVERTPAGWGQPNLPPVIANTATGITTVSCVTAAFCIAGGTATVAGVEVGITFTRTNGVWDPSLQIPNLDVLANGARTSVASASCWAVGMCAVTGAVGTVGNIHTWVAEMRDGIWTDAQFVPGESDLGADPEPKKVSCASTGLCVIAGQYSPTIGGRLSWASVRSSGSWTTAQALTPVVQPDSTSYDDPDGVACTSTSCTVGGGFMPGGGLPTIAWISHYVDEPAPTPTTTTTATEDPVAPAFTG